MSNQFHCCLADLEVGIDLCSFYSRCRGCSDFCLCDSCLDDLNWHRAHVQCAGNIQSRSPARMQSKSAIRTMLHETCNLVTWLQLFHSSSFMHSLRQRQRTRTAFPQCCFIEASKPLGQYMSIATLTCTRLGSALHVIVPLLQSHAHA